MCGCSKCRFRRHLLCVCDVKKARGGRMKKTVIAFALVLYALTCNAQSNLRDSYEIGQARGAIRFKSGFDKGCEFGSMTYAGFVVRISKGFNLAIANSSPNTALRRNLIRAIEDERDDYQNKTTDVLKELERHHTKEVGVDASWNMGYNSGLKMALSVATLLGTEREDRSEQTYKRLIEEKCTRPN